MDEKYLEALEFDKIRARAADGIVCPEARGMLLGQPAWETPDEVRAALEQTDGMFYIICDQESAGNPQRGGQNSWGNDIDSLIADGSVLTSDTLEGLAEQIGCDADVLVAEIEKYNSYCESGVDEDFQKVKLGGKIDVGPFWATPRKPSIHHTMGGLEINTDAQVLDVDGNVIPGLYAAGEVTGGIHAGNRVGGNALPDIIVFGRIAGQSAAAGK